LAAGEGPTLRISQDANKVLGVDVDFDKDWKFPDSRQSGNADWPLPADGVLISAIDNEGSASSSEGSAWSQRIFKARRDTLAQLEGRLCCL
jgi:hypothetical protein